MIAATNIFHWHNGSFDVSGWGLAIIFLVIMALFAFAERGKF